MAEIYRHIERHAGPSTVVAASGFAFGARLAKSDSVSGRPLSICSRASSAALRTPDGRERAELGIPPMWFKRAFFRLADWLVIDRVLKRPLNEFR